MMTHAIRVHEFGGPEVLRWEEVDVPPPGPGQVLLRHTAVGINFIDVYHRTGRYPNALPLTPGTEGAGRVEAIGEGVEGLSVGDRVAYASAIGAYAERRLVPADRLVPIPDKIEDDIAASTLLRGMTVRYLIKQTFPLAAGQIALVHAAAGGVGLVLCQWAAALGARVIGTVSTRDKAALAEANGCHRAVVTSEEDFLEVVKAETAGKGVPVVYDSVGRDTFDRSLECLSRRGMLVLYGQSSGPIPNFDIARLATMGSLFLTRPSLFHYTAERHELLEAAEDWFSALSTKLITVEIGQRFPLDRVADAHRALESRATIGSTVLTVDD